MKKQWIIFLVATLPAVAALSQESFTLKEAIHYSLEHHGSNVIYSNQVAKVKQQSKEALASYLPQVSATAGLDDNLRRQTTVLPGAMFGEPGDIAVQFGNKFNASAVVQLDQTIYDQALLYGIKAGIPSKKIAELELAKNNEELIYNTASAYSQILLLKEQQNLLLANEEQYQQLYTISKFRFDKGVGKKVDMDKAQVQLNNVKTQLTQIETDIQVAHNSLKNAMGLPLQSALAIEDSLVYENYTRLTDDSVNVHELMDYKLQEQNIALQEIDVKRKQAAYLPTLSAYARYGQQSFGNDIKTTTNNWNSYSAVGLKLSIPIFSGRRREAQLQQSKLELANQQQTLALNMEQLELQFQNAGRQLKENLTTLANNKSNLELAKTVYETSQFEYSKGVATMSDLLNADFSYQQAQTNYMTALLNLVSNRLAFEKARGSLRNFINQL